MGKLSHNYYVYIMASLRKVLYAGMTNDLPRRVHEHKNGDGSKFTSKYNCYKLVYYEHSNRVQEAIAREKEIKGWTRAKKIQLIEETNPQWLDLSEEF
jgi:putative endonuclease